MPRFFRGLDFTITAPAGLGLPQFAALASGFSSLGYDLCDIYILGLLLRFMDCYTLPMDNHLRWMPCRGSAHMPIWLALPHRMPAPCWRQVLRFILPTTPGATDYACRRFASIALHIHALTLTTQHYLQLPLQRPPLGRTRFANAGLNTRVQFYGLTAWTALVGYALPAAPQFTGYCPVTARAIRLTDTDSVYRTVRCCYHYSQFCLPLLPLYVTRLRTPHRLPL